MPDQNNNNTIPKPVTNPELVDAMATFKLDLKNRENERAFLQAAVEARYLLPAMVEQPAEPPKEGEQLRARIAFQIMTNQQNEKFMPAFTDEIELRKNRQPGERFQVAVMSFMDLYRFVKANEEIRGIVINPFGSALCLIRQQVIMIGDNGGKIALAPRPEANKIQLGNNNKDNDKINLAGQPANPQIIPPPQPQRPDNALGAATASVDAQQAAIRQAMADMEAAQAGAVEETPDAVTDSLIAALKAALKKQKQVKKAYIRQERENGESYLLVALEADDSADIDEIGNAVRDAAKDSASLPFEFVPATSIRAKELIAEGKPFYEKKRFGIF